MAEQNTFNWGGVKVAEAELPKSTAGRSAKYTVNPFAEPMKASLEAFKANQPNGKSATIPGAQVTEAIYLIRKAATELNCGSRVIVRTAQGKTVESDKMKDTLKRQPRANFTVLFAAKNRKEKRASEDTAAAPGDGDTAES